MTTHLGHTIPSTHTEPMSDLDLTPGPLTAHLEAAHRLVDMLAANVPGRTAAYEALQAHAHHMREISRHTAHTHDPDLPPTCSICSHPAIVYDKDEPYCLTHWPSRPACHCRPDDPHPRGTLGCTHSPTI